MASLRPVRFLAGLSLVAAGVTLAAPPAGRIMRAFSVEHASEAGGGPLVGPLVTHAPPVSGVGAEVGPRAVTQDAAAVPHAPQAAAAAAVASAGAGVALAPAATPPPMATPTWGERWEMAAPALGRTYRSALEAPPPPLLDESPAAPRPTAVFTGRTTQPQQAVGGAQPATYRVRDGDDLASIAERFYGHPGAASRLWAANRDRLSDPAILPIGLDLQLPPTWEVDAGGANRHTIEPRAAGL